MAQTALYISTDNDSSFVHMEIGNTFNQNKPEYRKVLSVTWNMLVITITINLYLILVISSKW